MDPVSEDVRDKSIRLFTYLRELTQLKSKVTLDLKDYEKVIWFSDIPNEKECFCIAWGPALEQSSETWVEIRKPKRKDPPELPEELKDWVTLKELRDSSKAPNLRETNSKSIIIISEKGEQVEQTLVSHFSESPKIQNAWTVFLEKNWKPWADGDQRLNRVETIYKDLFSIQQKQQKLGETFEVVIGMGLLTWKTSHSKNIRRHLLTTRAIVSFDARKGVITIGPPAEGTKLELEQEMIDPQKRPDSKIWNSLEQQAQQIGEELWDKISVETVLKMWTNSFSSDSQYEESLIPQSQISEKPTVYFAPAIVPPT